MVGGPPGTGALENNPCIRKFITFAFVQIITININFCFQVEEPNEKNRLLFYDTRQIEKYLEITIINI